MDQSSKENGSTKTTKSMKRLVKSIVIKVDNVKKDKRSRSHSRNKDYENNRKRRRKESREYGQHRRYGAKNEGEHRRNYQRIEGQRSEKIKGKRYYGEQTRDEVRQRSGKSNYGEQTSATEVRQQSEKIKSCYGEQNIDEVTQKFKKVKIKSSYDEPNRDELRQKSENIKDCNGEQNIDEVRQRFEKVKIKTYYGERTHDELRRKSEKTNEKYCYGEQNNAKWRENTAELKRQSRYDEHNFRRREKSPRNICRKPCSFFNSFGNCRFSSGHYIGFTKQVHICSYCLEFLGEDRFHSAVDCNLKKKICERENGSRLKEMRRKNDTQYDQAENNNSKEITDEKIINWKRTVKNYTQYDQVEDNNPKGITEEKIINWKRNVKVLPELRKPANFQGTGQLKSINYLEVSLINNVQAGSNMKKELETNEQDEEEPTTHLNIKDKVKNVVKQTLDSFKMEIKTEELDYDKSVVYLKDYVPKSETRVKLEKVECERDLISADDKKCKLSTLYANAEYFETEDEVGKIYIKSEGAISTATFQDTFTANNSNYKSSFSPNVRDIQSSVVHQEVETPKLNFPQASPSIHNYLEYPDLSQLTAQIELHLAEPLCLSSMMETECVPTRLSSSKEAEYIGKGDSNNNSTNSQPFAIYNSHNGAIRMTQSAITVKSEPIKVATSDSSSIATQNPSIATQNPSIATQSPSIATQSPSATNFTCDLCGVNASSNMDLGLHLLGRDHKDKLKAWLDVNV